MGFMYGQSVPQAFNYQGIAIDTDGSTLSDTDIGLRFSVREGSLTGTVIFQETHSATTTGIGQFSINVGMGSATQGAYGDMDWKNNAYFLEVELDGDDDNTYDSSSTVELLSVPYALFVEDSDNSPVGQQGLAGPQGPQGPTGPQGPQGPRGTKGPDSGQGPVGEEGDPGPQGATGPAGPKGPNGGTPGDAGPIGPKGLAGTADGPAGAAGAQGPQGPQGDEGPQGATGPQGVTGTVPGPQGDPGPSSSEVGPKGPTGPAGPGGGPKGANGISGTSCWDTNGNGLGDASEDNNGDGTFNAADCQGAEGAQGPQGAQGPTGPAGQTGLPGPAPSYAMTSSAPNNPSAGAMYLDDGSNRADGTPGFRRWDGSNWTDL